MNFSELESTLVRSLALTHRPVAVSFLDTPPAGVPEFKGEVPSGCTFWQLASAGRSFYTSAKDHYNCAVGCHTHNIALPKERESELMSTVSFMVEIGYIRMEEVPGIARMEKVSQHVVYAPLADAKVDPAVLIVRGAPGKLMLLQEAGYRAGVKVESPLLARPTCMAIPAALSNGTTMSTGCVGNRVYTGLNDNELYVMVPGADLSRIADQLQTVVSANATLTDYHSRRKQELMHV